MTATDPADTATRFALFRHADARPEDGIPIMRHAPMTPAAIAGGTRLMDAGIEAGHENRLLFSAAGFSLTHVWFKSGYPLPRHAHDGDCLYYVVAGSLRIGTETLGQGDGFFVGGGVPYTYTPGPQGVEVLEFRAAGAFDIRILANNAAFWDRALKTVTDRAAGWADEPPPSAAAAPAR